MKFPAGGVTMDAGHATSNGAFNQAYSGCAPEIFTISAKIDADFGQNPIA